MPPAHVPAHTHVPFLSCACLVFMLLFVPCRDMPSEASCSYDGVFDKGTVDAILCGEKSTEHGHRMLREVCR